jgi:hypothetical protein
MNDVFYDSLVNRKKTTSFGNGNTVTLKRFINLTMESSGVFPNIFGCGVVCLRVAYYSTGQRTFETKFAELTGLQLVLWVRSFTFFRTIF